MGITETMACLACDGDGLADYQGAVDTCARCGGGGIEWPPRDAAGRFVPVTS